MDCVTLDLVINRTTPEEGIKKLLTVIKSKWDLENVEIKKLPGGASGAVFRCFEKSDPKGSLSIRCGNEGALADQLDIKLEQKALIEVAKCGFFPPVLACFKNGYCFEYIHGNPLFIPGSQEIVIDEECVRLIAIQAAKIHSVKVPEVDYTKSTYFDFLARGLEKYTQWDKNLPTKQELLNELNFIKEYCETVSSPFCLCHGDLQPGNMIRKEGEDEVIFIDWEGAHIGPRAGDLAQSYYHLGFAAYIMNIKLTIPDEKNFLRILAVNYIQQWNKIHNKMTDNLEDNPDVHQILKELEAYKLAFTFKFVFWFCAYPNIAKNSNKDSLKVAQYQIDRHMKMKNEVFGFTTWGPKKE